MAALDRRVDIDVIKVMSDFTLRNQNEITRAIGKSDKKSTDRVKVHRAVHRTAKYYARSRPPGLDDNGKFWVLRKDLETIGQIVTDYPELFSHFQSQDAVLGMLVDKHVTQVCPGEQLSEAQENDFKHRLMMSATFFRLYLFGNPDELVNIINTLFSITGRWHEFEQPDRACMSFNDTLDVLFKACVGDDVLNGRECGLGVEFIASGLKKTHTLQG